MIQELRIYDIVPGQMERQLHLFKETVIPLFDKHSIKVVGFWETTNQDPQQLIYICEFESEEHLGVAWRRFREDSEWLKAKVENDMKGPSVAKITSTLMKETSLFGS